MKGLLLKDFFMLGKHFRFHVLIILMFLVGAFFSGEVFFFFYPCMLAGMFPVTLLAYDEQNGWMTNSGTLPYSRAQIVASKYIICLILTGITFILTVIAQILFMLHSNTFSLDVLMLNTTSFFALGFFTPSLTLPFMFKLGVQKGRIAYFVCLGIFCGGVAIAASAINNAGWMPGINSIITMHKTFLQYGLFPVAAVIVLALFALSCMLSISFHKAKEL